MFASSKEVLIIEGPECAGKSTVIQSVRRQLPSPTIVLVDELASLVGRHYPLGTAATYDSELALLTINGVMLERFRQAIACEKRVIADRGWMSQIVYSRVRRRLNNVHPFDASHFNAQERILMQLFPDVVRRCAVVYLDIRPSVSMERLKDRNAAHRIGHDPDSTWMDTAYEEYQSYFSTFGTKSDVPVARVSALGSRQAVFQRFTEACDSLGFPLTVSDGTGRAIS